MEQKKLPDNKSDNIYKSVKNNKVFKPSAIEKPVDYFNDSIINLKRLPNNVNYPTNKNSTKSLSALLKEELDQIPFDQIEKIHDDQVITQSIIKSDGPQIPYIQHLSQNARNIIRCRYTLI